MDVHQRLSKSSHFGRSYIDERELEKSKKMYEEEKSSL